MLLLNNFHFPKKTPEKSVNFVKISLQVFLLTKDYTFPQFLKMNLRNVSLAAMIVQKC